VEREALVKRGAIEIGAVRWAGFHAAPMVYRGNGVWTAASILEFAEAFPQQKVPGVVYEVVYGPRASLEAP
jgi:hypothetical protein